MQDRVLGQESSRRLQGRNILLIEDDPQHCHLLSLILTRAGANVAAEADGLLDHVTASQLDRLDAVIVDFLLPGRRGTELVAALRMEGFRGLIVGIASVITSDVVELWQSAGVNAVLLKSGDFVNDGRFVNGGDIVAAIAGLLYVSD